MEQLALLSSAERSRSVSAQRTQWNNFQLALEMKLENLRRLWANVTLTAEMNATVLSSHPFTYDQLDSLSCLSFVTWLNLLLSQTQSQIKPFCFLCNVTVCNKYTTSAGFTETNDIYYNLYQIIPDTLHLWINQTHKDRRFAPVPQYISSVHALYWEVRTQSACRFDNLSAGDWKQLSSTYWLQRGGHRVWIADANRSHDVSAWWGLDERLWRCAFWLELYSRCFSLTSSTFKWLSL